MKKNNPKIKHPPVKDPKKQNHQHLLILFCLLAAVFISYLPALHKQFINFDDNTYITENPFITNFSFAKIPALFTNFYQSQYSPIPSLIYGIFNMLVGFRPFLFNLFAVVMHLVTIILVYKLIMALCSNFRVALITAAFFGIATLQVESIAWLAAVYKTCTYSIFFLTSLILYVRYIKTNKNKFLIFSFLLFIAACFCKEQAVSLSLAVVTIDIFFRRKLFSKKVILEKIPFFLISVVFGLITIAATRSGEPINISTYTIFERIIYASYALCMYIFKLFIPVKLSLFYPYFPIKDSMFLYLIFPLLLLIIIGLYAWAIKKKNNYIIFGGLFFLFNMLFSLALQVVAVRPTIMADRYVYLASIGIFFMVAKGADILVEKKIVKLPLITVILVSFFLITADLTYSRTRIWDNSMILWNDVISKYQNVQYAFLGRGNAKKDKGDMQGAFADYEKAIEINPKFSEALADRGNIKLLKNDFKGAIEDYNRVIAITSISIGIYTNRGVAKAKMGDTLGAMEDYNKDIEMNPSHYQAYFNRALAKKDLKDFQGAVNDYNKAIALSPKYADAYNNKGVVFNETGKFHEAIISYKKAIEINPEYLDAYCNLAVAEYNLKRFSAAMEYCEKALSVNPDYQTALNLKTIIQKELQKTKQ